MPRQKKEKKLKFDAQLATVNRGLEMVMERMGVKKWDYRRLGGVGGDGAVVAWVLPDSHGADREYQVRCSQGATFKDNLRACEQCLTLVHRVYDIYKVETADNLQATLDTFFIGFQALPDQAVLALPPPSDDPWKVLGISRSATISEIKDAYRTLSKKFHPDTSGKSSEEFVKITRAKDMILEMRGG
jgi:hypothetical protein